MLGIKPGLYVCTQALYQLSYSPSPWQFVTESYAEGGGDLSNMATHKNLPNVEKWFYFFYVIDELVGSGRLRKGHPRGQQ